MKTRSASGKIKTVNYEEDVASDNQESEACPSDCDETDDDKFRLPKKSRQSYSSSRRGSTKARKGKSRGKNVGKLSKVLDMPVEIFSEICTHLEPLDLLRLARTTRGCNQVLMSRKSRPIWRAARSSITDLPDCPPDLNELEYARLIFEKDCQVCLASRGTKVDWFLRSRLCKGCRTDCILTGSTLLEAIPGLTKELLECCNYAEMNFCMDPVSIREFYSVRVHALVAKYRSAVPEGLPLDQIEFRREAFLKQHKDLIPVIRIHARALEAWFTGQQNKKSRADAEIIDRRVAEIQERLVALGYRRSDFPEYPNTEWYKILRQPRDLTPKMWDKVRPRLEACIQIQKIQREEAELRSRRNDRRLELNPYILQSIQDRRERDLQLYMHHSDVFVLPTVQAILAESDSRGPITNERWNEAKDQVEKEMDEYSENIRKHLISDIIARKATTSSSDNAELQTTAAAEADLDFLVSPSTFFECVHCGSAWCHYPEILEHYHGWSTTWKVENFHFDPVITELAQAILTSLPGRGESQLQAMAGKEFECSRCGMLCSWKNLVHHFESGCALYELRKLKMGPHSDLLATAPLATILTTEEANAQREMLLKRLGPIALMNMMQHGLMFSAENVDGF